MAQSLRIAAAGTAKDIAGTGKAAPKAEKAVASRAMGEQANRAGIPAAEGLDRLGQSARSLTKHMQRAETLLDTLNTALTTVPVRKDGAGAATAVRAVGKQANRTGTPAAVGLDRLGQSAQSLTKHMQKAETVVKRVSTQWGRLAGGAALPLAGLKKIGSFIEEYFDSVAQVARLQGQWSDTLEKTQKKQALLSRVTREDVAIYRAGRLALLQVRFALEEITAALMRALSPAAEAGIDLLNQTADWLRNNQTAAIRSIAVLAGTITAVLVPAFVALGAVMLTNPLTWIAALILGLALVINDLVTYIQEGEATFGELWARLGTGEEIVAALTAAWKTFCDMLAMIAPFIPSILMFVGTFTLWRGAIAAVQGLSRAFRLLTAAMLANPMGLLLAGIAAAVPFIIEHWDAIQNTFGGAIDWIQEKFRKFLAFFTGKIDWVKDSLGKVKNFLGFSDAEDEKPASPQQQDQALSRALRHDPLAPTAPAWEATAPTARSPRSERSRRSIPRAAEAPLSAKGWNIPTNAELTIQSLQPSTTMLNQTRTIYNEARIHALNIYTKATDAAGIARDMGTALQKNPILDTSVFEGGVR